MRGNLAIRGLLSGPGPRSELKFQGLERPKFICFPGAIPKTRTEFSELFPNCEGIPTVIPKISAEFPKTIP